jgi:hypothetical protein
VQDVESALRRAGWTDTKKSYVNDPMWVDVRALRDAGEIARSNSLILAIRENHPGWQHENSTDLPQLKFEADRPKHLIDVFDAMKKLALEHPVSIWTASAPDAGRVGDLEQRLPTDHAWSVNEYFTLNDPFDDGPDCDTITVKVWKFRHETD